MIPLAVLLTSIPPGSRELLEFGVFYRSGNDRRFNGIDMNVFTWDLFVTVVFGGSLIILVTVFTSDNI